MNDRDMPETLDYCDLTELWSLVNHEIVHHITRKKTRKYYKQLLCKLDWMIAATN